MTGGQLSHHDEHTHHADRVGTASMPMQSGKYAAAVISALTGDQKYI